MGAEKALRDEGGKSRDYLGWGLYVKQSAATRADPAEQSHPSDARMSENATHLRPRAGLFRTFPQLMSRVSSAGQAMSLMVQPSPRSEEGVGRQRARASRGPMVPDNAAEPCPLVFQVLEGLTIPKQRSTRRRPVVRHMDQATSVVHGKGITIAERRWRPGLR